MRILVIAAAALVLAGCNSKPLEQPAAKADAGPPPAGLSEEQAAKVLAKVEGRVITLGDYATALERMNEFDRLRYQAPEKRRELLNEMIDLELLAAEARRRGLDKAPETEEQIRQILRDTMLADARRSVPTPQEIPAPEVRAYYDAHRDEYREPERRRVTAIVFKDKKEAEKTLDEAKKSSPMEWGKLVQKYAETPPKTGPTAPLETLGDLGIVGPPSDPKGDSPRVPAEVRAAVFEIKGDTGATLERVVQAGERFYIVRLAGKTAAHERTFAEAERSIRGLLVQEKMEAKTRELEKELEKQFPVSIDEAALAQVKVPSGVASAAPPGSNGAPSPSASAPKR
jgi:DNA-directed RNA polymerase subunit F